MKSERAVKTPINGPDKKRMVSNKKECLHGIHIYIRTRKYHMVLAFECDNNPKPLTKSKIYENLID